MRRANIRKCAFTWLGSLALISASLLGIACEKQSTNYKERVGNALVQADLKGVTVADDASTNTLRLTGTLHSDEAKNRAGEIAQANAGSRNVANEISVEPVGDEGAARSMQSDLDGGIEKNFKAGLIAKGLQKQDIRYDVKNGVVTLKGSVKTTKAREDAQEIAQNTPNVKQVLNQLSVRR